MDLEQWRAFRAELFPLSSTGCYCSTGLHTQYIRSFTMGVLSFSLMGGKKPSLILCHIATSVFYEQMYFSCSLFIYGGCVTVGKKWGAGIYILSTYVNMGVFMLGQPFEQQGKLEYLDHGRSPLCFLKYSNRCPAKSLINMMLAARQSGIKPLNWENKKTLARLCPKLTTWPTSTSEDHLLTYFIIYLGVRRTLCGLGSLCWAKFMDCTK